MKLQLFDEIVRGKKISDWFLLIEFSFQIIRCVHAFLLFNLLMSLVSLVRHGRGDYIEYVFTYS